MKKQTIIIIAIVAAIIIYYFYSQNNATVVAAPSNTPPAPTPTPGQPGTTTPGSPVAGLNGQGLTSVSQPAPVSQPAAVSQPAPVSQTTDQITPTPVVLNSTPSTFAATATDAETQGNSAIPVATDPLAGYPTQFAVWVRSLQPKNQAYLISILPTMSATDINFINTVMTQQLWGSKTIEAQWNAFVAKYGLPVGGSFNNFSGSKKRK
jgi:hypothetical protein